MTDQGQAPWAASVPPTILFLVLLTPHSLVVGDWVVGEGVVGPEVTGGWVDWNGAFGSAQHNVKSNPSNPHGFLIAWNK